MVCKVGDKFMTQLFHRDVMGLEPGEPGSVVHIDGNILNNTTSNLKVHMAN